MLIYEWRFQIVFQFNCYSGCTSFLEPVLYYLLFFLRRACRIMDVFTGFYLTKKNNSAAASKQYVHTAVQVCTFEV